MLKILQIVWASPNTLLGLLIGTTGILFGGKCQIERGCFEFYGGPIQKLLTLVPIGSGALAMTIGHTILGQTKAGLAVVRDHEHIHVKQYERWGPLFIPAYFLSSAFMWLNNKDPYRDNPFEVEAYDKASPTASKTDD